jgi:hypothetical protein
VDILLLLVLLLVVDFACDPGTDVVAAGADGSGLGDMLLATEEALGVVVLLILGFPNLSVNRGFFNTFSPGDGAATCAIGAAANTGADG